MADTKDGRPDAAGRREWRDYVDRCWSVFLLDSLEKYLALIDALTAHLASDPDCLPAYNNRAVAYDEIGEVDKAEPDFKEAVRRVSDDSHPLKNYAMFLEQRRGDIDAAIALYRRALSISTADATLHRCMAHALVKRDRHLEALAFFTAAIKLNPTFARTYRDRADAFRRLGRRLPAAADRLVANILDWWQRARAGAGRCT